MLRLLKNFNSFKNKNHPLFLLASGSGGAVAISILIYIQYKQSIQRNHTYINDAIEIMEKNKLLKNFLGEQTKINILNANFDSSKRFAKCKFKITGNNNRSVIIYASAKKLDNEINSDGKEGFDENFIEREKGGLSYYWKYPFLLKKHFLIFVKENVEKINSFFSLNNKINLLDSKENENRVLSKKKIWILDSVFAETLEKEIPSFVLFFSKLNVLGRNDKNFNENNKLVVLYGEASANPYLEAFLNNDGRTMYITRGRFLTYVFLSLGSISFIFLSAQRIFLSYKKFVGIGFVKSFVKRNLEITKLMGSKVNLVNITGVHKSKYVNSKVYLQAQNGRLANLILVASRNNLKQPFTILRSELIMERDVYKLKPEENMKWGS